MTLDQWLEHNIARLAELYTINGDQLLVTVVNQIRPFENRYGRLGINVQEAFELTYLRGVIDCFTNCSTNPPMTARSVKERLTREAQGQVIEIVTPEKLKEIVKCLPPM